MGKEGEVEKTDLVRTVSNGWRRPFDSMAHEDAIANRLTAKKMETKEAELE